MDRRGDGQERWGKAGLRRHSGAEGGGMEYFGRRGARRILFWLLYSVYAGASRAAAVPLFPPVPSDAFIDRAGQAATGGGATPPERG